MQQVITAKLKLNCTPEQKEKLRAVTLAYRDALNYTSKLAFEKGKISYAAKLQKQVYYDIRERFRLPAQMACNVPRQVATIYKNLWMKVERNATHLKSGITNKRYKGLDTPPKFIARTCTFSYKRDYSFVKGKASLVTLEGRIKVDYSGYQKHLDLIHSGAAKIGTAIIGYAEKTKTYYLLVSLELNVPNLKPEAIKRVVGVDVGQRYLAVTFDTNNTAGFFSGKSVIHRANRYSKTKQTLQQKGTRSATRRLRVLSQRERRFNADINHCIAKRIVISGSLIGLENITENRDRIKSRQLGQESSKKAGQAHRNKRAWEFTKLHDFIDYKAVLGGALVIRVDADFTSQSCPRCGHTSKGNRPNQGLDFDCIACGYKLHADLVAAKNIALRTLLLRQDFERTGRLSTVPDVSQDETKTLD